MDGHTISPGYDYDAAKKDMVKRLGKDPKEFFLTRDMTRQKFAKIQEWGKAFTIFGTPVYQEFLAGKRELTCTAWAIPTYNVKGWKAPCYLMTDGHYGGYQEMLDEGAMGKIRRRGRRGARPALRELHGPLRLRPQRRARHELSIAATTGKISNTTSAPNPSRFRLRRNWRSALTTAFPSAKAIWPRPRPPSIPGRRARKARFLAKRRAQPEWRRHEAHVGSRCGTGDTSERDELLAKIKDAKKVEARPE